MLSNLRRDTGKPLLLCLKPIAVIYNRNDTKTNNLIKLSAINAYRAHAALKV
jgi:hypothetical protein